MVKNKIDKKLQSFILPLIVFDLTWKVLSGLILKASKRYQQRPDNLMIRKNKKYFPYPKCRNLVRAFIYWVHIFKFSSAF